MPKKTVKAIVESGNDYIIEVKGNQPTLYNKVKAEIALLSPINYYKSEETNRGRKESRESYIYEQMTEIVPGWTGINRLIKLKRSGIRKGTPYEEIHYFISSLELNQAKLYSKAIRTHWGIENGLHYVKDVNMHEDQSGIKGGHAAENLSILKNMAINIYRYNGNRSIKYAIQKYTNRITQQLELIKKTCI